MPKILILQLPRHGREFKVYEQIAPTFQLNLSNIVEGGESALAFGFAVLVMMLVFRQLVGATVNFVLKDTCLARS